MAWAMSRGARPAAREATNAALAAQSPCDLSRGRSTTKSTSPRSGRSPAAAARRSASATASWMASGNTALPGRGEHGTSGLAPRRWYHQVSALVAQGIERRPPEPGAQVRILPRAPISNQSRRTWPPTRRPPLLPGPQPSPSCPPALPPRGTRGPPHPPWPTRRRFESCRGRQSPTSPAARGRLPGGHPCSPGRNPARPAPRLSPHAVREDHRTHLGQRGEGSNPAEGATLASPTQVRPLPLPPRSCSGSVTPSPSSCPQGTKPPLP